MRTAFALALAIAAAPAFAADLPFKHGFYARADRGCDTRGDPDRYVALLHVDGDGIGDSVHVRQLVRVRQEQGALLVDQRSQHVEGGIVAPLTWIVCPLGPGRFVLLGAEDGTDWSGQWEWCGEAIP